MTESIGRNKNTNTVATVTTVTINSSTATVLCAENLRRNVFIVNLDPDISNIDAFIRLYPASDDNTARGILLTRRVFGNDNLYYPCWHMPVDNIYTGEISAISDAGTFDLHITEY